MTPSAGSVGVGIQILLSTPRRGGDTKSSRPCYNAGSRSQPPSRSARNAPSGRLPPADPLSCRSRSRPDRAPQRQLEHTPGIALLIDEADNLDLFNDRKMRQIFNYGHETSGADIGRFKNGRPQKYSVSAPLTLGTIQELPRPLMSRSIAVKMHRTPKQLKPFDETDRAFIIVREAIGMGRTLQSQS